MVKRFLHKQSEEQLKALGAVNEQGMVDLHPLFRQFLFFGLYPLDVYLAFAIL